MLGPVLSYSTLFYMVRARPDVKPFFLHIIFDQTGTPFVNLPLKIALHEKLDLFTFAHEQI